jgi:osmotically inducible lipoprotein OsmB
MKKSRLASLVATLVVVAASSGCASWDHMSHRSKSMVTGAGIGGVAGAVVTGGGVLGTVGGAAIGGVIGDQLGKR